MMDRIVKGQILCVKRKREEKKTGARAIRFRGTFLDPQMEPKLSQKSFKTNHAFLIWFLDDFGCQINQIGHLFCTKSEIGKKVDCF